MEPTILKNPRIYKGAGGIYKGRGVYNDVKEIAGLIYKTNFSNFDKLTGVDVPLIGPSVQWTINNNNFENEKIIVDGIEYDSILFKSEANIESSNGLGLIDFENDDFSIEAVIYKKQATSLVTSSGFGSCYWCIPIAYNGYSPRYNKILQRSQIRNNATYYNGFTNFSEDFIYKNSEFFNSVNKLVLGGMTKKGNLLKFYIGGLKSFTLPKTTQTGLFSLYAAPNESGFNVVELSIYKNIDRFEQME